MGNRFFDFLNGGFPGFANFNVGNSHFFIGGFSPVFLFVNIVTSLLRISWNWIQTNRAAQGNQPANAGAQNDPHPREEAAPNAQNASDAVFIIVIVVALLLFSWFLQKWSVSSETRFHPVD